MNSQDAADAEAEARNSQNDDNADSLIGLAGNRAIVEQFGAFTACLQLPRYKC